MTTRSTRPTRQEYNSTERQRRASTVNMRRAEHGNTCPGWGTQLPHPVLPPNTLTADHVVAVGAGGDQDGELAVTCRDCNSPQRGTDVTTPLDVHGGEPLLATDSALVTLG